MKWETVEIAKGRFDSPHKNLPERNKDIFVEIDGIKRCGVIMPFRDDEFTADYGFYEKPYHRGYAVSNMKSFKWLDENNDQDCRDAFKGGRVEIVKGRFEFPTYQDYLNKRYKKTFSS